MKRPLRDLCLLGVGAWAVVATSKSNPSLKNDYGDLAVTSDCADAAHKEGWSAIGFAQNKSGLFFKGPWADYGLPSSSCEGLENGSSFVCQGENRRCLMVPNDSGEQNIFPFICYDDGSEEISCTVTMVQTR